MSQPEQQGRETPPRWTAGNIALLVIGLLIFVTSGLCSAALLGPQIVRDVFVSAGLSGFILGAVYVWPAVFGATALGAAIVYVSLGNLWRD